MAPWKTQRVLFMLTSLMSKSRGGDTNEVLKSEGLLQSTETHIRRTEPMGVNCNGNKTKGGMK